MGTQTQNRANFSTDFFKLGLDIGKLSAVSNTVTLDFWIAIPAESDYIPASYGPYVGFNLRQELYGSRKEANPEAFPAY